MKRLFYLFIFASIFSFAQEVEDMQEGYFFSETSKNFFRVDIKKPYDYYQLNSCSDDSQFRRAQFEGGDAAFNRELFKYISAYVDREIYVVNVGQTTMVIRMATILVRGSMIDTTA